MIKNYRGYAYFDNNPEIVKIFNDLEAFHNFCRMEMAPFNEADLYNRGSWVWRNYEKSLRSKGDSGTDRPERKPYQGKNPRYSR
jgi:hypothetical protein